MSHAICSDEGNANVEGVKSKVLLLVQVLLLENLLEKDMTGGTLT